MASVFFSRRSTLCAAALAALSVGAQAQPVQTVNIAAKALPTAGVAGFGDALLQQAPLQASMFGAQALREAGATSLSALARLDAGVADAYNSEGYWSALSVRGFVLDARSNYRRDGLPINAETAIGLQNKDRVEVLKGISGMQAGISAPGGLVNLVVKRPDGERRDASVEWRERGSVSAAVDLGGRIGTDGAIGLRLNAAAASLRPQTHAADGRSHLLALSADARLSADSLLEFEFETSLQRQPSVPGFSLLGGRLPDARQIDPRTNLNNQPWSQPVLLQGDTASLRWRQRLGADWRFSAHGAVQQLRNHDRVAFPFGCYDAVADRYWADRYCPDGRFDVYDYRSDAERRRNAALDLQFSGRVQAAGWTHELSAGIMASRARERYQRQAYNFAGSGAIDGRIELPAAPELTEENTQRDERSTEWYVRDRITLGPRWSLWAGWRHTSLQRQSVRTDGSRVVSYRQSFSTPWLALLHQWDPATTVYLSSGRGIETDVAPNRARYINRGQPLPALQSRQVEAGVKHVRESFDASLNVFRIVRPLAADIGPCDVDASCTRRVDGDARHQGIEASIGWRQAAWSFSGDAAWLDAQRRDASDPALDGRRPANVPARTLTLRATRDLPAVPGAQLQAALAHQGPRNVLPDNSVQAPGWTRIDLALRWRTTVAAQSATWLLGLDNASNTRAWRETPYQFGHAYLFPQPPRQWRLALQTTL